MKKYVKPTTPQKANTSQPKKNQPSVKRVPKRVKSNTTASKQSVYKSQKVSPTKTGDVKELFIRKNDTPKERKHPEYGTSNLETRFAKNFLDKLGYEYKTQYKAESIGRYYDFYIVPANLLIEIDGGYWHSDPRLYEGKELTPTQKRNKRVDKDKDKWAQTHKIPLIRIWEDDINKTPKQVMDMLKSEIPKHIEKYNKELDKKKRPK
jgi:very-short-patch-repair endonuclease